MMIPDLIGSRSESMRDHQDSSRRRRIRLWRAGVFAPQKQSTDGRRPEESWYHPNTRASSKSLMNTREKILPPGIPSAGIQVCRSRLTSSLHFFITIPSSQSGAPQNGTQESGRSP
jgi:hypothetical protein